MLFLQKKKGEILSTPKNQINHKPTINQERQPETSFLQVWLRMWKNLFKFYAPHCTDRREFALNFVMGFVFVVAVLSCLCFCGGAVFWLLLIVLAIYCCAFLSLMARRLRDAGFSAWLVLPLTSVIFVFYQLLILLFKDVSRALQLFFMFGSIYLVYFIVILALCFFPTNKIK